MPSLLAAQGGRSNAGGALRRGGRRNGMRKRCRAVTAGYVSLVAVTHRPASATSVLAGPPDALAAASGAASSARTVRIVRYYAFDINNGGKDPGFIPAPGTSPKVFSQGDELIINDQITTTHRGRGGYPIVGYDAGANARRLLRLALTAVAS